MRHILNLTYLFVFYLTLSISNACCSDLDVHKLHQTAVKGFVIESETIIDLKPTYTRIYKNKSCFVPNWEYPLELDFTSKTPKLLFNDPIPDQESLKNWERINFGADILLGENKDEIGFFQLEVNSHNSENDIPYIYFICINISEEYQGKGYGKTAISCISQALPKLFPFAKRVEYVVDSQNPYAAKLFKSYGCELTLESKLKLAESNISEEDYFKDSRLLKKLRFVKEI